MRVVGWATGAGRGAAENHGILLNQARGSNGTSPPCAWADREDGVLRMRCVCMGMGRGGWRMEEVRKRNRTDNDAGQHGREEKGTGHWPVSQAGVRVDDEGNRERGARSQEQGGRGGCRTSLERGHLCVSIG